jgi:23S rRNA (cytosine1962-C5)-methyltransferase
MKKVVIAKEKVPVVLSGHPWIFSGACTHIDPIEKGELVHIVDTNGTFLALGYANPFQSLLARILSYEDMPIEALLEKRLTDAYNLRLHSGLLKLTNAYRLINAEGDRLGGLIVDVYDKVAVIQVATCGIERLKSKIIELLVKLFDFTCVIERSDSSSRNLEGLEPICAKVFGTLPKKCMIFEGDVTLEVDLENGQKTGFFLDQRPMRMFLGSFAKDLNVLNVFSYTGGFSLHALKNGAKSCTSVDVDKDALALLDQLVVCNKINPFDHKSAHIDAFDFLQKNDLSDFDLVILDPPAFAKKRGDIDNASKGYKKLMTLALSKMKDQSFLYVASCSYFMDEKLFEKLLLQASMETRTSLKLLSSQIEAIDHPRLLSHKEGSYLKGFFVQVSKN